MQNSDHQRNHSFYSLSSKKEESGMTTP